MDVGVFLCICGTYNVYSLDVRYKYKTRYYYKFGNNK